jgi:hypothetical protein
VKPLLWMRAIRDAQPGFRGKRLPVLWALALRMGPNGQGFASHHVLAVDADVSEHTARRSTREARDRGYLDQTRRGGRRGTGVVMASEWALTEPSQPVTGDTLRATPTGHPLDVSDGPQTAKSGSPNGHPLAAQEVLYQEVSSKTPYVSTGPAPVAANGGKEPHKNEPNARRAIAALIRDRTLPFTVEQLLELAYAFGNGDPWDGYLLRIKAATEQSFTGARDPTRVLHKRLGLS